MINKFIIVLFTAVKTFHLSLPHKAIVDNSAKSLYLPHHPNHFHLLLQLKQKVLTMLKKFIVRVRPYVTLPLKVFSNVTAWGVSTLLYSIRRRAVCSLNPARKINVCHTAAGALNEKKTRNILHSNKHLLMTVGN